jgi:hypothetical protein
MTSNLNAHRLLKEYQGLAAGDYPDAPRAFSALADLAGDFLANVPAEQRLPAMILQNIFHTLSQDLEGRGEGPDAGPVVAPDLHAALLTTLKFVAAGGDPARCIQVSEQLVRVSPMSRDRPQPSG